MGARKQIGLAITVLVLLTSLWLWRDAGAQRTAPPDDAPAVGRWQIHRSVLAISEERARPGAAAEGPNLNRPARRSSTNTILLDSATGETWLLWTSADHEPGYIWTPLVKGQGQRLNEQNAN